MRKKSAMILICILSFSCLIFLGCSNNNKESLLQGRKLYFDEDQSKRIADDYMEFLYNKDFKRAADLCTEQLAKEILAFDANGVDILNFKLDEVIQKGNSIFYKYKVAKSNVKKLKMDLDNYYVRVDKTIDKYQVYEVKAGTEIEGFVNKQKLFIRNKDEVNVKPVIDLATLPGSMYPKNRKANIEKLEIPKKQFGIMSFSFEGNKIAISSLGENKTYVGVLDISGSEGAAKPIKKGDKEEKSEDINEKPIGKKINSIDVYEGVQVTKLTFTKDNSTLVVNYLDKGSNRFKQYTDNGDVVQTNIDEVFPIAQYSIIYGDTKEDIITFEVKGKTGAKDIKADVLGQYKLSLKNNKLTKV